MQGDEIITMKIENVKIYGEDFKFHAGSISFDGDTITDVAYDDSLDASGKDMVIPGLIDLHFHGCNGCDFTDGTFEAIEKMAEYEAKNGITAICPSTMPVSDEQLMKAFRAAASYESSKGAELIGINMEGPYLTHEKAGGNDPRYLKKPSIEEFEKFQSAASGKIKIVDIAPDTEGASEFIRDVSKTVVISLAHTPADYEKTMEGFRLGASLVTHLFNGMAPFSHRETGLVGAAMDAGAYVELICDGRHVSDPMLRAAYRIFGEEKIIIISDSLSCTGLPDGVYPMGELVVTVKNGLGFLDDGTIAGASANAFDGLRHLVGCGIPVESAVRMATYNPAKVLNVLDRLGTLSIGKTASFLVLNDNMELKSVYLKGRRIV